MAAAEPTAIPRSALLNVQTLPVSINGISINETALTACGDSQRIIACTGKHYDGSLCKGLDIKQEKIDCPVLRSIAFTVAEGSSLDL